MSYAVGDEIELVIEARTLAGPLTDPTTLVARVKPPVSAEQVYTYGTDAALTRDGEGLYRLRWTLSEASAGGRNWCWRLKATGALIAAKEGTVVVAPSAFADP